MWGLFMAAKKLIDENVLNSYPSRELVYFLHTYFKNNVFIKIQEVKELAQMSSDEQLKNSLHALKNSFANVGAQVVAEYCQSVEDKVEKHGGLSVVAETGQLAKDFDLVSVELDKYVAKIHDEK